MRKEKYFPISCIFFFKTGPDTHTSLQKAMLMVKRTLSAGPMFTN